MVRGNARFLSGVHGVLSTCGLSQTRKPSRQWDEWDWSSGERSSLQRSVWESPALRWWAYLVAQTVKNLPAVQEIQETWVRCLGQEDPLKGMATHSSILAWRIPWTEETGGLQSMRPCRVRNDWVTNTHTHTHTHSIEVVHPWEWMRLPYWRKRVVHVSAKYYEERLDMGWLLWLRLTF